MTPIANCKFEFAFQCPKRWTKLAKTADPDIRFCSTCSQNVYLCNSMEDVHRHASKGNCIAVPPQIPKMEHLIGTPPESDYIRSIPPNSTP